MLNTISSNALYSICSGWEMALMTVSPFHSLFLFAFTSPSVQVKESSDHSFSRCCSDAAAASWSLENTDVEGNALHYAGKGSVPL